MSRILCVLMLLLVICMTWCDTALAHGPRGFAFRRGVVGFRAPAVGFYAPQQLFVPQQQIYLQPQPFVGYSQGFQGYTAPSGGCGQLLIIR